MIRYGQQEILEEDVAAVVEVLRSDFLTQGDAVPSFEKAMATGVGARFASGVNSATSALHLSCLALGLGPGDRLWTSPNTFVASANCAAFCGADPDFVDIDPQTWNMSIPALREKLEEASRRDALPKVVVPVHFGGQPVDQEAIWELSREFGFRILEDAAHALGAERNGRPVGDCRWSDITVFSFHPVKIITTGEGGMALTNDPALDQSLKMNRSHGITRDRGRFVGGARSGGDEQGPPSWYYEQQELGFNYRMSDIHAALGLSQYWRLEWFIARRNELARQYDQHLRHLPIQLPEHFDGVRSSFHLYVIRVPSSGHEGRRRVVFDYLRREGIGVGVHYMPVHLQPYYRNRGFTPGDFPQAELHGEEAITLPLHPGLSDADQMQVVSVLEDALALG